MNEIKDTLKRFPQEITFQELYNTASRSMAGQRTEEAEYIFRFLIENKDKIHSQFIGASYFKLGEIFRNRGNSNEAETCFNRCLHYIPDHLRAATYLGKNNHILKSWDYIRELFPNSHHSPLTPILDAFESLYGNNFLIDAHDREKTESLVLELCSHLDAMGKNQLSQMVAHFFLKIFIHSQPLVTYLKQSVLKPADYTLNDKHLASIIIPYYNGHEFISETLFSIDAQTYRNFEVLIVDNGSELSSRSRLEEIIKQFHDISIRILDVEKRRKGPRRNLAVSQAEGDFILPLDCDDQIAPQYMEYSLKEFANYPESAAVYSETIVYGDINYLAVRNDFSVPGIFSRNQLNVTALIRKSCFNEINGYREELPGYEDWDLWIRMTLQGMSLRRIPQAMFFYRKFNASRGYRSRNMDLQKRLALMTQNPMVYRQPHVSEMPILKQNTQYIPEIFLKENITDESKRSV